MERYIVFLRHRTGFVASMVADAHSATEAVSTTQPLLGEGWKAVGALISKPEVQRGRVRKVHKRKRNNAMS